MAKTITKDGTNFERVSNDVAKLKVKQGYRYVSDYERKRIERVKESTEDFHMASNRPDVSTSGTFLSL